MDLEEHVAWFQYNGCGHASPNWFVYTRHGFDARANWQLVRSTFFDYMDGGRVWLAKLRPIDENNYWLLVRSEIDCEFELVHRPHFFQAIGFDATEVL